MINTIRYFKCGNPDTSDGISLSIVRGDFKFNDEREEITKEEYNEILVKVKDGTFIEIDDGIYVSKKGMEEIKKEDEQASSRLKESDEKRSLYYAKRIKKEIELGIIDEDDILFTIKSFYGVGCLKDSIIKKL